MTEYKFELQSYFILYLHLVIILSLSKDIVSYLHIFNLTTKPCFALCLYIQKNIEIWYLTLLLKTGNIVHELVTESFTNQKTRLTIVHERLFSINRGVQI
jgi:hypothetical protein